MAAGLVAVHGRTPEGGPVLDTTEEPPERLEHTQPAVAITLNESSLEELGTLYITTRRLIWLSSEDPQKGYAVDFISLTMHAISRDLEAYPKPCIYTQIESGREEEDEEEGEEEEEEEQVGEQSMEGVVDNDLSLVSEMRLIPQDPNALDHIFKVLCDCAALNPDPLGEQEGEGEFFYSEDEVAAIGSTGGNHVMDHLDELLTQDEARFQDADDDDEEYKRSNS